MKKYEINLEGADKPFLDWVDSLNLIPNKEDKNILELGCGFGTQFLCNEFKNVYSFEVYKDKSWFDKTTELLNRWDNWHGTFYTGLELQMSEAIQAIYDNPNNRNEESFHIPNGFYDKLNQFVNLNEIDVVFVDHNLNMRGETVNYFLNKGISYIFAHDTNHGHGTYGWNIINESEKYDVVKYNSYQGVTFWIKK